MAIFRQILAILGIKWRYFLAIFNHIFDILKHFGWCFYFFVVFRQFLAIFENVHLVTLVKGVTGTEAEIICEVTDIRDPLEDCDWYSPAGDKYSGQSSRDRRRSDHDNNDIQVIIDDRRDECILTIKSLRIEDSGPWECVAYDGRDEASRYAIIRVTDKKAPLTLLLGGDHKFN